MDHQDRILVVSNEDQEGLVALLQAHGLDATSASDVDSAMRILEYLVPALIAADYPAVSTDGVTLSGFVRRMPALRATPLIALLPPYERRAAHSALAEGYDEACVRPLDRDALLRAVRRLLPPGEVEPPLL